MIEFIVKDKKNNKASIITDNRTAIIKGEGYIADILKIFLERKQLTRAGMFDEIPERFKKVNENGIVELKTESIEFLETYLPKICKSFSLDVIKKEKA